MSDSAFSLFIISLGYFRSLSIMPNQQDMATVTLGTAVTDLACDCLLCLVPYDAGQAADEEVVGEGVNVVLCHVHLPVTDGTEQGLAVRGVPVGLLRLTCNIISQSGRYIDNGAITSSLSGRYTEYDAIPSSQSARILGGEISSSQ